MIRGQYPSWAVEAGLKTNITRMKEEFPEMATIAREACSAAGNDNIAARVQEYADDVAAKAKAQAEEFLSLWQESAEARANARLPATGVSKMAVKALLAAGQTPEFIAEVLKADLEAVKQRISEIESD